MAWALREKILNSSITTLLGPVDSKVSDAFDAVSNSLYHYVTPQDYESVLLSEFPKCDLFISSAAVLDFDINSSLKKISRHELEQSHELILSKKNVPDFVAWMGQKLKTDRQKIFAFSLDTETEEKALERAKEKVRNKNADWIFVNFASNRQGPDKPLSEGFVLNAKGQIEIKIPEMKKRDVAQTLVTFLITQLQGDQK